MNTKMSLVLLGLVALAVASEPPKDNYDEEQGGYGEEPRGYESREAARQRNPYYGGPYYMGDNPNNYPPRHQTREYRGGRYYYGGTYKGQCYNDGLYYMDQYSFVLCSNKNAYVQPCAPGTRNSARNAFRPGYYYGYSDFCDVNLVDYGYGPQHYAAPYAQSGYDRKDKPSYGEDRQSGYGDDRKDGYGDDRKDGYGDDRKDGYGDDRKDGYGDDRKDGYGDDRKDEGYGEDRYGSSSYGRTAPSYGGDSYDKVETYAPRDDYKPQKTYPPKQSYQEETYSEESYGEKKTNSYP